MPQFGFGPAFKGPRGALEQPPSDAPVQKLVLGPFTNVAGTVLAGGTVKVFDSSTDVLAFVGVTDANGMCTFVCNNSKFYYAVFYLAGTPDIFATTSKFLFAS